MIIKQFKYYGSENLNGLNNPNTITEEQLISGNFFDQIICQEIKIKTLPEIILTINGEVIQIGETGTYDILFEENVLILSIQLKESSVELLKSNPKTAFFIVTFIQKENE